ncbi:GNAT family N-acetyltransferase [Bacillus sp. B-jedd]|uniref:GNAT family N-acetyltransferase n=1 Tax=Bacillus sp. B-jedd TaxID=1476857 RepID=UPI00051557C3|nr:GNAT family N-acetyltransferase [Bacillus sp. B-jedd]CEG26212.1 N-acetyltransferase GCN5 [Bacillus sp. B-jedd]
MHKLTFEKFEEKDFPDYFKLVSDEQVMVYITGRALPLDEAQAKYQKILERNQKQELFGSYKVSLYPTNDFFGFGHLIENENDPDEAEIGYMMLSEYWGKGYGYTIASHLIDLAKAAKIIKLKAIIDPNNIPSRKILLKHGFTSEKICEINGLPGEILRRGI